MKTSAPESLIGVTWVLVGLTDETGAAEAGPSAHTTLTFRDGYASDNHGNAVHVAIREGYVHFTDWTNDLVGRSVPDLTYEQRRLVFAVLSGDVAWEVQSDELTLALSGTGSLRYASSAVPAEVPT